MRKALTVGITAAALAAMAAASAPASAGDTSVTFTIASGGLSLTIPTNPPVSLNGTTGLALGTTSVVGSLNPTTVTDSRGSLAGTWKVQVSSTDFDGPEADIPDEAAGMYIDVADLDELADLATGGMVPLVFASALTPADLGAATPATLVSGTTALTGTMTYTPKVKVTIPANTPAGTYTGTVTQTAS